MEETNKDGVRPPGTTQDEQLLESPGPDEFTHTDTWRVFRIMGEFVERFDALSLVQNGSMGKLSVGLYDSRYAGAGLKLLREAVLIPRKGSRIDLRLCQVTHSPSGVDEIVTNSKILRNRLDKLVSDE